MRRGKTRTGFECEFDERIADDMRFLDLLAELMGEDLDDMDAIVKSSKLITMLLGKDLKKKMYDHVAELNDGFVPSQAVMAEVFDILKTDSDLKN